MPPPRRRAKANGSTEIDQSIEMEIGKNIHDLKRDSAAFRQPENGDDQMSANNLNRLLRRMTEASTREIENLIDELHRLRKKLETDHDRIQSDVVEYAALSQGAMQLTTIIADSVKTLPGAPASSLVGTRRIEDGASMPTSNDYAERTES